MTSELICLRANFATYQYASSPPSHIVWCCIATYTPCLSVALLSTFLVALFSILANHRRLWFNGCMFCNIDTCPQVDTSDDHGVHALYSLSCTVALPDVERRAYLPTPFLLSVRKASFFAKRYNNSRANYFTSQRVCLSQNVAHLLAYYV